METLVSTEVRDVIVVGAGPAGSTAANEIAKAGYDVAVIEREKSPGMHNACGGAIGYFLKHLFELPQRIVKREISRVRLQIGNTDKLYQSSKPLYISVLRNEFDSFLAERAAANGAQLFLETRALDYDPFHKTLTCIHRPSRTTVSHKARLFIFADGARSLAWRACRVGVPHQRSNLIGIARELHAPGHEMDTYEFIFDAVNLPYGYLWVFPKGETISVGISGPADQLSGRISRILDDWLETRPELRDLPCATVHSGLIPTHLAPRLHAAGVMAVGDAGGFVNPLTGAGIFLGMKSAQVAAKTAVEALQAGRSDSRFLSRYTRRIKTGPIYTWVKSFGLLVRWSEWHRKKTGKVTLGPIFKLYSDVMFYLLQVVKDI
jgi:geranylgeranyl reductase family protein